MRDYLFIGNAEETELVYYEYNILFQLLICP